MSTRPTASSAAAHPFYDIHASTHIAAQPSHVYALASDITRMGEWSPENTGGEWTSDFPGAVGARFRGHNEAGGRTWTTECEVVAAEPDRRFAWEVLADTHATGTAVWSFEVEEDADGARLTQRFVLQEVTEGFASVRDQLPPEHAENFFENREAALRKALQHTIAGIKQAAEN
ncbi:SRPBCC family protein [Parasphingorhabdus pacifica]